MRNLQRMYKEKFGTQSVLINTCKHFRKVYPKIRRRRRTVKELFDNVFKSLEILYDNVRSSDVYIAEGYILTAEVLIKEARKEYYHKYKEE